MSIDWKDSNNCQLDVINRYGNTNHWVLLLGLFLEGTGLAP